MVDSNLDTDPDLTTAYWDFATRIVTPIVGRRVPAPQNAHTVELGFGDGRLLCPATQFFGNVTGLSLDASDDESAARKRLGNCTSKAVGFDVVSPDGDFPLADGSVEFVYSLTGVERLTGLTEFERTVAEISRVLKPGGVAMLWFGRLSRMPFAPLNRNWFRGWTLRPVPEGPGLPETRRLHMRMFHARRAVMRAGMRAVALSTPLHPDTSWRLLRGGQMSYVTALKPA